MILKMKMWIIGMLTILFSLGLAANADAKGCGCSRRTHATYGYHAGYVRPVRHHVYYRPFYGYRRGMLHDRKFKLKVKHE